MRRGIAFVVALLGLALLAAPASADHHFMKIREVSPGSAAAGFEDAFVELQMFASGQNFVGGKELRFYDDQAAQTIFTFPDDALNGQNQRTILVGDSGVPADFALDDVNGLLSPDGGATCFVNPATTPDDFIDCVAYGNFIGGGGVVGEGTPTPAIPGAQSLTRSIARGCATLLEAGDDTDDSATDFALTAPPTPRPNSVTPTEQSCGGPGGGGGDNNPPNTEITKGPKKKIEKHKAKFKFSSSEPGSSFECKLDKGGFKKCDSPEKVKGLDDGKHKFRVRATDQAGNTDPTPAKLRFRVV